MVIIIKIVQVVFALSLLVLVHELGHFFFAKLFGTRVDKFYLFFNPKFSIIRVKKFNGRFHFRFFSRNTRLPDPDTDLQSLPDDDWNKHPDNTEYGIGWLPLGGYCTISGMIDESMNVEQLKKEPQKWELRTKPAWQRFLIMFGGVFFNFILAIFIYAGILHTWGEEYIKNDDAVYGIAVNDLSYEIGFRDGDKILRFDQTEPYDFQQLQIDLVRSMAKEATVLRGKDTIRIDIDPVYIPAMLKTPGMFGLAFPFIIDSLIENSINVKSGLQRGDSVLAINDKEMRVIQEIQRELKKHKSDSIVATVGRNSGEIKIPLSVDTSGMIQVVCQNDIKKFFNITEKHYSFFAAIPAGIKKAFNYLGNYVKELGLIFSPKTEAYKSVGSFIAIGKIFPGTWDWYRVWLLTAMLSIMLAVLNLVPIPGLDGGHILFIFVEMITGRKPSDKFLERAQTVGMILLLTLMVLAFGNDIRGLFIK